MFTCVAAWAPLFSLLVLLSTGRRRRTRAAIDSTAARFGVLVLLFPSLFATALARQRFLCTLLFAGLQLVGVTFHFLNDVFLLHLALEAPEGIL